MSSDLAKLKAELEAARAILDTPIDGLQDLVRSKLNPKSQQVVTGVFDSFRRRRTLINGVLVALVALEADGYPAPLEDVVVSDEVFADLLDNVNTIKLAFSKFHREMATSLGVTVSRPEDK